MFVLFSHRLITFVFSSLLLLVSLAFSPMANALLDTPPASTPATTQVQDTFGRDTPRGTVQGFLQALAKNDVALASRYLNVSNNSNATKVVEDFKAVLDSGGKINSELQINNTATGDLDDKLSPNIDKVGEIQGLDGKIDITLERIKQSDNSQIWLFSRATLQKINHIQTSDRPTLVDEYLPSDLLDKDIKGYSVGHLVAVCVLLIATYLMSLVISWLLYALAQLLYRLVGKDKTAESKLPIDGRVIVPLAMVITGVIIKELMLLVGINLVVRSLVERLADILSWVALAWLLLRILDLTFSRAEEYASKNNHPERLSVLNLLKKVLKVLFLALAIFVILGNMGFDLTTGVAALGIGGLALALGAQKTIENLVGSVSLVADQPVSVGDYCKFGTQEGTVEDIGIRSTRLRTSNRTIVTIPNGSFSSMSIENFSRRDMFYFNHNFFVSRDSDTQKVREFIEQVQIFITNHPATNSVLNQVRIAGTQQDAYLVEVKCYMEAKGVIDFNDKQTELILKIAEMMSEVGLNNALPTRHITVHNANHAPELGDEYSI
ncbi:MULTISPECIES: mechanosensitive ion channel family protein [unclassified Moraxella]|uniref:mechanosensitive ion channel family protein n=1 Tax=unclassified Moraxella TaxID=2685852 RepID=UPI003AF81722